MVSPSIVDDKPHVPASSSVPSVLQLPQFIDSLNVGGQASQDKLEGEALILIVSSLNYCMSV